jgi:hypothetical protein
MRFFSLFLLQSSAGLAKFKLTPSPVQTVIFVIGVTAIVLVFIFLNKSAKVHNSEVFKTGAVKKPQLKKTSVKGLGEAVRKYGLSREDEAFLARVFQSDNTDVSAIFQNGESIDKEFSRIASQLSREEDADEDVSKLFAIRNKIERYITAEESGSTDGNTIIRRYKRARITTPVAFYTVAVTEVKQGFKKIKKMSVNAQKLTGVMVDFSAGGCAITAQDPVAAGTRIKIEFKIGRNNVAVLGQVLRVNKAQAESTLHVRFLKVSPKSLNAINTYIYGYRDF